MATGYGYGKVILFGEHFVVHRRPTIASGISRTTVAELRPGTEPGFKIIDNRLAAKDYKDKYIEQQKKSVENMNNLVWGLNFEKTPVEVTLAGDLYCASGVGASAASCVAMARAVSEHFDLGYDDEQINQCGLEGDKAYAKNPSGVDNTCSTYGGLIYFRKGRDEAPNTTDYPILGKPLDILMVSTGITAKTEDALQVVEDKMAAEPELCKEIFDEAEAIVEKAMTALAAGDLPAVGKLMDLNHILLQRMGVNHELLDYLVELCRKNGALGAKMTGGGMGGYMVALFADANARDAAAKMCKSEGYEFISARIG
ncbi:MAG: mevalonate kinase [Candidatus Thermoplasmatota archaeon]|nr:mevalonate kinase [Euryarchaeota archaeon]MBU4031766.1 mevalonate kinase [Candidatus Thermoplasmatota archaeon]MBU4072123.1 mevalonate kinase [Candidatus Thermoplasmatota archaeon]MBU4145000.1 mevalonate kinase [Candidatus Thermoplasmatota archaeon]MBU4592014.1 mevalonate kinase [Candidatus Thermoplasmatota archaeon]